jgi:hypothetical protein
MISLFMTFSDPSGERWIRSDEVVAVAELVGSIPGMTEGLLFTPLQQSVDHPYKADGSGPVLALQLRFPTCSYAKRRWIAAASWPAWRQVPDCQASPDCTSRIR